MVKLTWHQLCGQLNKMSEEEVEAMLNEEVLEHRRPAIARRLHQRFTMLRAARERAVIMKKIGK